MNKDIEKRIELLKKYDVAYETGNPIIDDDSYDIEKEDIRQLVPTHDYFSSVGGIAEKKQTWQKEYVHKYIMGSLFKDKSPEEFEKWIAKTYPNTNGLFLMLQVKLDGSSSCCIYNHGQLETIASRGDGIKGFDITATGKFIKDIPHVIDEKKYVEIKGEFVKDKDSFYKIWEPKGFNDPRSFVPGTLNSKPDENIEKTMKERDISFIAYEVRGIEFKTESEKLKYLEDMGFRTLKSSTVKIDCTGRTHKEIATAVKKYMEVKIDRKNFEFQLDGIVVKNNDIEASEALGITNNRPKGSRAVKYSCEQGETLMESIEYETGKSGAVTPVAILKPIFLSGATISRASLHNIKEIERLGIDRLPYKVILIRSGDIIPKVIKGIGAEANSKPIKFPTTCSSCGADIVWDKTKTNKICPNENCPAQLSGKIDYYLKTIEIKGIGSSTIDTLIEKRYVKSLSDMYKLEKHMDELSSVFGDKASSNIINAMSSVKEVTLAKFIESLSIGSIGSMSKHIVKIAPTIEDVDKLTIDDLLKIDGFADIKASGFVNGWKSYRKEIETVLKYITIKASTNDSNKLSGKKFCFTGSFSIPRDELEKTVEKNGGTASSSVGKGVILCWDGAISGSKYEKAKKNGNEIISEDDFMTMLK